MRDRLKEWKAKVKRVHIISFLGTSDYDPTVYEFPHRMETRFFLQALIASFERVPEKVSVLVTEEAEAKNYHKLEAALRFSGFPTERLQPVRIPYGSTPEELWAIFDQVINLIEPGEEVVFDITHSFRFIPVILLVIVLYLQTAKDVRLRELYYGVYREGLAVSPVFRFSEFLDMLDWLKGAQALADFGDSQLLGRKLGEIQDRIRRAQKGEPAQLKKLGEALGSITEGLRFIRPQQVMTELAELVKEYGWEGKKRAQLETELEQWAKPFTLLLDSILENYEGITQKSLAGYLSLIDWYRRPGYYAPALTLLRETFVTACVWRNGGEEGKAEFEVCLREEAENQLNNFADSQKKHPLGQAWRTLRDLRNDFAHCGFRKNFCTPQTLRDSLEELLAEVKRVLFDDLYWRNFEAFHSPAQRVLLTPMGMSPGLLYSALKQLEPEETIVLTSEGALVNLDQAVHAADYQGRLNYVIAKDPFRCFSDDEIINRCQQAITLSPPFELVVNITGGTTALQYIANKFYRSFRGRKRLVALVDERSVEEQRSDPFQLGEVITVEDCC